MSFFLLLLTAAAVLFTVWPALRGARDQWEYSDEDTPMGRLATRREVLVGNLADLDFEFAMGKVSEEDYMALRNSLKRQTLKIMEQMEVVGGGEALDRPATITDQGCSSCGEAVPRGARFCPGCGANQGG